MKTIINDGRIQIGAAVFFFILALIDGLTQHAERWEDLTAFGKICTGLFCLVFGYFLLRLLIAIIRQVFQKKRKRESNK